MFKQIALLFLLSLLMPTLQAANHRIQLNAILNGAAVFTINGQQVMLNVNQSKHGVKLSELTDTEAIVMVSGQLKRIKLGAAVGKYRKNESTEVRISKTNGMYLTSGQINNAPVMFLVDTGATVIALNSIVAKQVGIDYRGGRREIVDTAGGQTDAWSIRLNRVDVGGISLYNVDAVVIEGEYPRHVLLGMSFLNQIQMNNNGLLLTLMQTY